MNNVRSSQTPQRLERQVTHFYQAQYWLFLPEDYAREGRQRWPLMVFLHGMGERGNDLSLVRKHGPPKIVDSQPGFPFILVSPQCPADRWWQVDTLNVLLDEVLDRYAVDPHRVYLTGLSMGGFGTWSWALQNPERFAAIAPICGGGVPLTPMGHPPERAESLKTMGIWAFHGAKDPVVALAESQRMVDFLRYYGCQDVKLTVYPEAEHDSWTQTYDNPQLNAWFLAHQRSPFNSPHPPNLT